MSGRPAQVLERDRRHQCGSPPATRNPIPARRRKDRYAHHCNDHLPARGSRQAHDWHVGKKRRRQRQTSGIAADFELRTQRQDEKGRGDRECETTTEDTWVYARLSRRRQPKIPDPRSPIIERPRYAVAS